MAHSRLSVPLLALTILAGLSAVSCAPPRSRPPESPVSTAERRNRGASALLDRDWEPLVSTRFFVAIPLFDAKGWHRDDSGRWFLAWHPASRSMLWIRAWRETGVVSKRDCEAQGRKWRPDLFGREEDTLAERHSLGAPTGFDTDVAIRVSRHANTLAGVVVAMGARVRQCLLMAYATRADGPDAPEVIAERLAFVEGRVFSRAETRSIDDRLAPPR